MTKSAPDPDVIERQLRIVGNTLQQMQRELKDAEGPQKRLLEKLIDLLQRERVKLKRTLH